jgi:hypothetical protein
MMAHWYLSTLKLRDVEVLGIRTSTVSFCLMIKSPDDRQIPHDIRVSDCRQTEPLKLCSAVQGKVTFSLIHDTAVRDRIDRY